MSDPPLLSQPPGLIVLFSEARRPAALTAGSRYLNQSFIRKSSMRYFVYILASQRNGTLYIGSTSNLKQRIWQHKNNLIRGFTSEYNVHLLVYYEEHQTLGGMAQRERRLKEWQRKWKLDLIEKVNPTWQDLFEEICQ